jgi:hypothetical protein
MPNQIGGSWTISYLNDIQDGWPGENDYENQYKYLLNIGVYSCLFVVTYFFVLYFQYFYSVSLF